MNKKAIIAGLAEFDKTKVEIYVNYLDLLLTDKKNGKQVNWWMNDLNDDYFIGCFKRVAVEGLDFDGKHITLLKTGITFDYVALKNKMLLVYPESIVDVDLVYDTDVFSFKKESGKVFYSHDITNPFGRKENNIVGGYCVIKNRRGEFLTLLSKDDIEKHRKVARTDFIWKAWLTEMYIKTVSKKGFNAHFKDIFQNIIDIDNENSDLTNPLDIPISTKGEIEAITDVKKLGEYYHKNKSSHVADKKGFDKLITDRKTELEAQNENN